MNTLPIPVTSAPLSPNAAKLITLRNCAVFRPLSQDTLDFLSEILRVQIFKQGETVCGQGEPASEIFIIQRGHLTVHKEGEPGVLAFMEDGELFGEFGMFGRGVRLCTVIAQTDAVLLSLDYDRFRKFLLRFPECALSLLQVAVGRFVDIEPI